MSPSRRESKRCSSWQLFARTNVASNLPRLPFLGSLLCGSWSIFSVLLTTGGGILTSCSGSNIFASCPSGAGRLVLSVFALNMTSFFEWGLIAPSFSVTSARRGPLPRARCTAAFSYSYEGPVWLGAGRGAGGCHFVCLFLFFCLVRLNVAGARGNGVRSCEINQRSQHAANDRLLRNFRIYRATVGRPLVANGTVSVRVGERRRLTLIRVTPATCVRSAVITRRPTRRRHRPLADQDTILKGTLNQRRPCRHVRVVASVTALDRGNVIR